MSTVPSGKTPAVVTEPPLREPPIGSSQEVNVRGIFELPPVEDENFVPTSVKMLSQAAYALAGKVPPAQITRFYKRLVVLTDDAIDWQNSEDQGMDNKFEESIRRIVRDMIKEASDDPDVIVPKKFVTSSPAAGMAADIEEEEPGALDPSAEELAADSKSAWAAAAQKYSEKPRWADINLKKKKTVEPWQQTGYQAEKPDDSKVRLKPGERDLDMSIADTSNVTGVSPGFIKAMDYKDRVTITDKLKFLTGDPKKVKAVISQAAVEWLDKLEKKKHIDNQVKLHAAIAYGHMADKPVESPEQIRAIVSKPGFDEFTLAWLESHTEPDDYLDYSDFREFLGSHLKSYLEQDPEIQQRMQLWSLPAEERKKKMAELGISED